VGEKLEVSMLARASLLKIEERKDASAKNGKKITPTSREKARIELNILN